MPLDHFVSQVHLRNFYSPELPDRMYAVRKRDLHYFTCTSKDVCRIKNGNTNEYLLHDRAIEEFLKYIEPKYNVSIKKLRIGEHDAESIYVISGFIAYVSSCSPAAMRIRTPSLKESVEVASIIADGQGKIPPPPPELGGETLTELLKKGKVKISVDPNYSKAIGINNILGNLSLLGNSRWEILINEYSSSPFFTSDYPIAIEKTSNPTVLNKIVPLSPNLALRILPDINRERASANFDFNQHSFKLKRLTLAEVRLVNQLIVKCAEKLVFYKDNQDWVNGFVSKNSSYRIELQTQRRKVGEGFASFFSEKICKVSTN